MFSRRSLSRRKLFILIGLCLTVAYFYHSCQGKAPPAPDIPTIQTTSPGAYRADEQIRLRLLTHDILELERAREYGKIYDRYGSRWFKRRVSRRDYLRMTNCIERTMGGLVEYDRNAGLYTRKVTKKHIYDTVVFPVVRSGGNFKEQLTYVVEGVDFKLNALSWSTTRQDFLSCIDAVLKNASPTAPVDEEADQPAASVIPEQGEAAKPKPSPAETVPVQAKPETVKEETPTTPPSTPTTEPARPNVPEKQPKADTPEPKAEPSPSVPKSTPEPASPKPTSPKL